MEEKMKQRLIGVLVLIGALFIILPFLFHNSRPLAESKSTQTAHHAVPTSSVSLSLPGAANNNAVAVPAAPVNASTAAVTPEAETTVSTTGATAEQTAPMTSVASAAPAPAETQIAATAPTTSVTSAAPAETQTTAAPMTPVASAAPAETQAAPAAPAAPMTTAKNESQPSVQTQVTPHVEAVHAIHHEKKSAVHHAKPLIHTGHFVIQLGAFSDVKNARKLIAKLHANHFAAYSRKIMHEHHSLIAVFVGPENTLSKVHATQARLKHLFHLSGVIRKNEL